MPNIKKENGQSLVEFALVLPILLILVFSIIDFGMLFAAKNQLEITTFAAARTISLGNAATAPQGHVFTVLFPEGDAVGKPVKVIATTDYKALTPILQMFFGSNVVTLTSNMTIVIEQLPPPSS